MTESCSNCMHSKTYVEANEVICVCPAMKKIHRNPAMRIMEPDDHCEHWDTLEDFGGKKNIPDKITTR